MRLRIAIAGLVVLLPDTVFAHVAPSGAHGIGWSWEPWVLTSLGTASLWYGLGIARLRRRRGFNDIAGPLRIAAFAAGIVVLFIALISPLDAMAEQLFSAHMVQHLLLLMVAPPLLVAGRPVIPILWAFAPGSRKRIARFWNGTRLGRAVAWLMQPVLVWLLFLGAFAFWHLPGPYQWALRNEAVHTLEHMSFFLTALMFWTIVLEPSGRRRLDYGATLVFVSTMAVVSGLPGALIFLAPRPLYPIHAAGDALWGLSMIEDQQIAGVVMWIPAGLIYVVTVIWVFAQWLLAAERRMPAAPRSAAPHSTARLEIGGAGAVFAACLALAVAAQAQLLPENFGSAGRGATLTKSYGCGACHMVPGIAEADGLVGPPLTMMGRRDYIAGLLRNTPDNMATWLRDPQRVVPGNAMPNMGITPQDSRDIAAYLESLR